MGLLKKSAEPFRVPSLEEVDAEYAAHLTKRRELEDALRELEAERADLIAELRDVSTPAVKPSVAALIGDSPDSSYGKRQRLKDVNAAIGDTEAAIAIVRGRIDAAKGQASVKVCDAAREEYGRRVSAICDALVAVEAARQDYFKLRDAFEAEDVQWTRLGPLSLGFLGDRSDGKIPYILREAKANGYYHG